MRFLIILGVLLAGTSFAQNFTPSDKEKPRDAVYKCSILTPPGKNDSDPGIAITITIEDGEWFIMHSTRSGQRYFRQEQYLIKTLTARTLMWTGTNIKRDNIKMIGEIKPKSRSAYSYSERVYDMNKAGTQTAQIDAECIQSFDQESTAPRPTLPAAKPLGATLPESNICKPGTHQPIPVIFGLNYDEARKKLIEAGWQPLLAAPQSEQEHASSGNGPELWAFGFREVRSCAGSGMANCTFNYSDVYNNSLSVFTTGEVSLQGQKKTWNIVSATSCRAQH
jgi:hypothetical protein